MKINRIGVNSLISSRNMVNKAFGVVVKKKSSSPGPGYLILGKGKLNVNKLK